MTAELVLLDTNVWRRVLDHDDAMKLRATLKQQRLRGAISSLVIDELSEPRTRSNVTR